MAEQDWGQNSVRGGAGPVLRRKVRIVHRGAAEGGTIAERAWRVAFARALRDGANLPAEFTALSMARMSLAEVLDLPPDRALILTLEGPDHGLGLLLIAPEVLSGMVEMMMLGRCPPLPVESRKPTRTDAAMIAPLADLALRNLESALETEADLVWTSDFHYASCLEDARPLALLLEDMPYRVLRGRLSLAEGARQGGLILVLPAEGRGRRPPQPELPEAEALAAPFFAARLAAQVELAEARIGAVLTRLHLPIADAMSLVPGQVLPLPQAALDRISLEGLDGRKLAEGRLGQQRGMRALRLNAAQAGGAQAGGAQPGAVAGGSTAGSRLSGDVMQAGGQSGAPAQRLAATGTG